MTQKHTPGPWKRMEIAGSKTTNIVSESRMVANTSVYSSNMDNGKHVIENEANADLIACAPELYAFIKNFIEEYEGGQAACMGVYYDQCKNLIEKVNGK